MISAYTQVTVLIRFQVAAPMTIETDRNIMECHCSMAALGIMEILLGKPFYAYIGDLTTSPVNILMFMILSIASNAPTCLLHAHDHETLRVDMKQESATFSDKIDGEHWNNIGHYKSPEHCVKQVDQQSTGKNSEENSDSFWKEELTILKDYSSDCKKSIFMPTPFESLWDGHLGWTPAGQDLIEPYKSDSGHLTSPRYRVEPKAREFKKIRKQT